MVSKLQELWRQQLDPLVQERFARVERVLEDEAREKRKAEKARREQNREVEE